MWDGILQCAFWVKDLCDVCESNFLVPKSPGIFWKYP